MKKLVYLLSFLSISSMAFAQIPAGLGSFGGAPKKEVATPPAAPKGSAKIVGYLLDSTDSKAVEFASVALAGAVM